MQESNINEKLLELENKLSDKIHVWFKESINTSTNKIMIFIWIITIILTWLWVFLWNYINKIKLGI